jgi:dipeptidyl aminopeptidase/acylaminoacyl peptidase
MTSPTPPPKTAVRSRRYWLRLVRLFVVALVGVLIIVPVVLGAVSAWALTHPGCYFGSAPTIPYENITFPSARNITQQGYFLPGSNGATIIIVPAYGNGPGAELYDAAMFNNAGFNVLTMNSRVCMSVGYHSLGYQEVEDVEAAYAYLGTRSDVDPQRVSLHGFSSAGATSLMAAARMPEIRAVTAEGGYHEFSALFNVADTGTYFDRLYIMAGHITYTLITGSDVQNLSPLNAIGQLGTRPVLLIYGSEEISLNGAHIMLSRALENGVNAELWIVPGAGHGNYLAVAGEEFDRRLIAFHTAALIETSVED